MPDADVVDLRRELERTKRKLEASLKLNSVLENANRELERLNHNKAAWKGEICGEVGRVRGMVKKLRSYSGFHTGASVIEHYEPPLSLMVIEAPPTTGVHRDPPHAMEKQQFDKLQCNNCHKVFKFKSVLDGHRRFCSGAKETLSLPQKTTTEAIVEQKKNSQSTNIKSTIKSRRYSTVRGRSKPIPKFKKCPHCPYIASPQNWAKHVRLHSNPNFKSAPKLWKGANLVPKLPTVDRGSKSVFDDYEPPLSIVANEGPATNMANRGHPQQLGKLQCTNCSKTFKFESVLDSHRRFCVDAKRPVALLNTKLSSEEHIKTVECQYDGCDFKTKWTASLKVHVLRIHQDHRPWECGWEECERTFSTKDTRDEHVRRIHTGERPFGCSDCGKWFAAAISLRVHKKSLIHLNQIKTKKSMAKIKSVTRLVNRD